MVLSVEYSFPYVHGLSPHLWLMATNWFSGGFSAMLNFTCLAADAFSDQLSVNYRQIFGSLEPSHPEILNSAGRLAIEIIANSDALYHNAEHTMLVTLVGQEIFRGRHLREKVTPQDRFHFTMA